MPLSDFLCCPPFIFNLPSTNFFAHHKFLPPFSYPLPNFLSLPPGNKLKSFCLLAFNWTPTSTCAAAVCVALRNFFLTVWMTPHILKFGGCLVCIWRVCWNCPALLKCCKMVKTIRDGFKKKKKINGIFHYRSEPSQLLLYFTLLITKKHLL